MVAVAIPPVAAGAAVVPVLGLSLIHILQLANIKNLPGVVGVVRADVGDGRGDLRKRRIVGIRDEVLEPLHPRVQIVHGLLPRGGVVVVKGLIIVARHGRRLLPGQRRKCVVIPEEQMVGQHSNGVVGIGVELANGVGRNPLCLFSRQSGNRRVHRHKPVGLVVR